GAVCVSTVQAGGSSSGTYPCGQTIGNVSYTQVALCRGRTPADGWDSVAFWSNSGSTGNFECARTGAVCVTTYQTGQSGGTYPCGQLIGNTGYTQAALCRARTDADGWDRVALWSNSTSSGHVECGRIGAACTTTYQVGASGGTYPCGQDIGNSGYSQAALCRPPTAADGWNLTVTWSNTTLYPNVRCVESDAECVDVFYAGNDSGSPACSSPTGSAGYNVVARCKTATLASAGWNTHVTWSGLSQTGADACAAIGGACVSVLGTGDGATVACGSSVVQGVARCAK
ncbi:MAG: hypothetical protein JST92_27030, partial [Deltaproteobacteria bacterium]|nr:hypothetical protein [Deltaproteobacteria bacterium]